MDDQTLLRYSRQIMLPDVDMAGQERLQQAHVLVVGLGGLGCPAALYLAAGGIGQLTLADDDRVDISNLQRQIAHGETDIGRTKVDSAGDAIKALNDNIRIHRRIERAGDFSDLLDGIDLALDCTDNLVTRFALNRACMIRGIPLVSGAAIRFEGQLTVFDPHNPTSPCYRCLHDGTSDETLACSEAGVIAPLVGVIGTLQAMEAIKLIIGIGEPLIGQLLIFDARRGHFDRFRIPRNPACTDCSQRLCNDAPIA